MFEWFGLAGLGGRSTDGAQTSLSSDRHDLQIDAESLQVFQRSKLSFVFFFIVNRDRLT